MSVRRSTSPWPGSGRITLVLLAVVPAAMAYPWASVRNRWLLGIAVAVAIILLARWHGLHLTTILRRRVAMIRGGHRRVRGSGTDVRATALLRITPPATEPDALPLPLIARYLDCYGIRADAIRITSLDTGSDTDTPERKTWIGLTVSAADNLAALRARSPRIPLHKTVEMAARRLADHLREIGWGASTVGSDDVPRLFEPTARETWRSVRDADYVAAYRVSVDSMLTGTLAMIRSYPAREIWTALEIAGAGVGRTLAVACAYRTDQSPRGAAPLPRLTAQSGNQRAALTALDPLSARRLDGHTALSADLLTQLSWPSAVPEPSRPRHAAAR